MTTPVRAAVWVRVSSDEQSTENQLPVLQELAARRGWAIVRTFELASESAWSGGSGGYQKALNEMLRGARRGEFQVLAIWSLDRLTRAGPLDALQILDRLGRAGVQVVSQQEAWLEGSPEFRELLIALVGWMAKWESQRRSERTKAGLERAKAAGVRLGRPPGAKDGKKRRRSGYFARWAKEHGE